MQAAAQQSAAPANQSLSSSLPSPDEHLSNGGTLVASTNAQPNVADLPDSPGTVAARSAAEPGETANSQSATAPQSSGQSTSTSSPTNADAPQNQSQGSTQKPVGTATADAPDTSGVAASQPAGVAIAPAKQKRTRTLVIKVAAIVAAAVAVGTIVALTEATSSKPPGAH
jgi:hypothetical protein